MLFKKEQLHSDISSLPKWQILDKVTIKFKIRNTNREFLWQWILHLSLEHVACFQGSYLKQYWLMGPKTAYLLWGQYKEPVGSTSHLWNWSSHWHGPTVLSTLPEWSLGKINLPAMQLYVKLACGIAYGMTIGWLVSQTWEDAREKSAEETHLSLKRQLPNTHCLPIDWYWQGQLLTEKNTAKKLTLGGMAEHRAQYLHFFEVSFKFWKSLLKIHSTVTRNIFSILLEWLWG